MSSLWRWGFSSPHLSCGIWQTTVSVSEHFLPSSPEYEYQPLNPSLNLRDKVHTHSKLYWICGSPHSAYEEYYDLWCGAEHSGKSSPMIPMAPCCTVAEIHILNAMWPGDPLHYKTSHSKDVINFVHLIISRANFVTNTWQNLISDSHIDAVIPTSVVHWPLPLQTRSLHRHTWWWKQVPFLSVMFLRISTWSTNLKKLSNT